MKKETKKENLDSSAFSHVLEELKKEKKKTKIVYSLGALILTLFLLSFIVLNFLKLPVLSTLRENIIGEFQNKEQEENKIIDTLIEDVIKQEDSQEEPPVEEIQKIEEEEVQKKAPAPSKSVVPTQPTYVCTDEEIAELRSAITKLEGFKAETEENLNAHFFACFDVVIETYPNQTDQFYQDECWREVCVNYAPDLCSASDKFQEGIDEFNSDLEHCLSDR